MRRREISIFGAAAVALTFLGFAAAGRAAEPTPVGSWFGIARPCPADPALDSALHVELCRLACGTCSTAPALPPEVPMMPTLLADGTVLADDLGSVGAYTTAHGTWIRTRDPGFPDEKKSVRLQATFLWLQPGPIPGSVRPRFVTYFDPGDPDVMLGFIQYYLFPFIDPATGMAIVSPASSSGPFAGNHIPAPAVDPLVTSLPRTCTLADRCLGTYHFVIRRVKPQ